MTPLIELTALHPPNCFVEDKIKFCLYLQKHN